MRIFESIKKHDRIECKLTETPEDPYGKFQLMVVDHYSGPYVVVGFTSAEQAGDWFFKKYPTGKIIPEFVFDQRYINIKPLDTYPKEE